MIKSYWVILFMLTESRWFFETKVLHNIWSCRFVSSLRVTWLCCILESNWLWRFLAHCITWVSQANSQIQWYSRHLMSHGSQNMSLHTKNEHFALLSCKQWFEKSFQSACGLDPILSWFLACGGHIQHNQTLYRHFQRPCSTTNMKSQRGIHMTWSMLRRSK